MPELENFRAALEWSLANRNDLKLGLRLAALMRRSYVPVGPAEAIRWVRTAQEAIDDATPPSVVATLDLAQAQLSVALARYPTGRDAALRAVERFGELDDRLHLADAQRIAGQSLVFLARIEEGEAYLRDALAGARALGANKLTCYALSSLADARSESGDIAGARTFYAEALRIARSSGADRWISLIASNLAETEFRGGNAEEALRLARESIATFSEFSSRWRSAFSMANIAHYLRAMGRYDESRTTAREALAMARDAQHEINVLFSLQHLAAIPGDRLDRSACLLGYIDARLSALEASRGYTEAIERDELSATLERELGAEAVARLTAEGRTWNEDRAVAEAMEL